MEKQLFCMDCGYDNNKMFLKLDSLNQDYVIRLKTNRKLFIIINEHRLQNYTIVVMKKQNQRILQRKGS